MQERMGNPALVLPAAMQALNALSKVPTETGLSPKLLELVNLRASQINGCSVCIDGHWRIARKHGETDERLFAVAGWRDAPIIAMLNAPRLGSPRRSPALAIGRIRCRMISGMRRPGIMTARALRHSSSPSPTSMSGTG